MRKHFPPWCFRRIAHYSSFSSIVGAFTSEPSNITVVEGESITFNCSMSAMNDDIATWIIDGLEYFWSDFGTKQIYSFNLSDNSLTINYSPTSLDGSSFQCILDNHRSQIGYLRVLHLSPTSLTTSNSSNPSTSIGKRLCIPLASFLHHIIAWALAIIVYPYCVGEVKSVYLTLSSLPTLTLPLTTSTPGKGSVY